MNLYEIYGNWDDLSIDAKRSYSVKVLENLIKLITSDDDENIEDESHIFTIEHPINGIIDALISNLADLEAEDYFGTEGMKIYI